MAGGPKKHKADAAIIALLTSPSIQEAAAEAGLAARTLRRWLQEAGFRQRYLEARRQVVQQAVAHAQQECSAAVHTWATIRDDSEAPPGARLRAGEMLVNLAVKGIEIEDLETHITALEASIATQQKGR